VAATWSIGPDDSRSPSTWRCARRRAAWIATSSLPGSYRRAPARSVGVCTPQAWRRAANIGSSPTDRQAPSTLSRDLFAPRPFRATPVLLREQLLPHLADLYELTHETVHLAVLRGTDIVYVNKIQGHRATRSPSRIGARLPAYCTGVGKALLAFDHDAAEAALGRPPGPHPVHPRRPATVP
jgi:hypothetical protein